MSTAKKFAGQTALYGVTTIAQRLLSSLLTPIYTSAYKPSVYGIFTTMFSYAAMLNAVVSFGMETTFFRYLNKEGANKRQVYNNGFWVVFLLSIFFLLLTVPFTNVIAGFIKIGKNTSQAEFQTYVKYFIAILVLDAWCAIPFAKLRADGRPVRYGSIKIVNIVVMVGLNLIFIWGLPFWLKHDLGGSAWVRQWFIPGWIGYVFLSNVVASVTTLILLLPQLLQLQVRFDKAMFIQMLAYSWPILVANLSYIVNENLDKLLLGKLLPANISEHEVGVYSACGKISIFLSIFIQAFRLGAEPFFFSHAKNKNSGQTYARIMNYFVITVCFIFLAVVANIGILKYYVRNPDYWVGLDVVPPLLFGYVSLGVYMNLSVWYKLSDQTKYGLYISGIGALLTIVLNVIFIPKYSYMASAWVSFAAYTGMMVMSYIWGQKNYPIPYNLKKNLAYIIISAVLVYLSFSVFKRNIFIGNGLLILFGLGALYTERNELKAIFNRQ
ncbi:oligosaccharide flippase family protein [Mucilaginibacter sp. RB4R14]|uniref:oligosaccharide flippase family protein n=1 Tax=Mucilaginibacter aurantiaciroseus TaxID=2949308 RepID=UPI002091369D|nr:polysaccharide biosynthesis C-terminal domain-containing protein [Mucilaginibacter aurantiaciroseus]MCO5937372.1 oligosaccharide flippase family protein [Mucilaginibacter aurantiaciroseus]